MKPLYIQNILIELGNRQQEINRMQIFDGLIFDLFRDKNVYRQKAKKGWNQGTQAQLGFRWMFCNLNCLLPLKILRPKSQEIFLMVLKKYDWNEPSFQN